MRASCAGILRGRQQQGNCLKQGRSWWPMPEFVLWSPYVCPALRAENRVDFNLAVDTVVTKFGEWLTFSFPIPHLLYNQLKPLHKGPSFPTPKMSYAIIFLFYNFEEKKRLSEFSTPFGIIFEISFVSKECCLWEA